MSNLTGKGKEGKNKTNKQENEPNSCREELMRDGMKVCAFQSLSERKRLSGRPFRSPPGRINYVHASHQAGCVCLELVCLRAISEYSMFYRQRKELSQIAVHLILSSSLF